MKNNFIILILIFFFKKIYRNFKINTNVSIDEYPIEHKGIKNYFTPLYKGKKNKEGYFLRYLNKNTKNNFFTDNFFLLKYYHLYNYEMIYGKIYKKSKIENIKKDFLIPITPLKNKNLNLKVKYTDEKIHEKKISIKKEVFTYLKFDKNKNVLIESDDKFIQGRPLIFNSENETLKQNILLIFVDGLPNFNNKLKFSKLMPNTNDFFNDGIIFNNHFSNSEWSLPSFASIFTGLYSHKHRMVDPNKIYNVNEFETLSSVFKNKNFLNFQIGSTARSNPGYGYCHNFDRIIYKRNMNCHETIFNFIEHNLTFKNVNQFNLISFFDLHHFLNGNASILSQSNLNLDYLKITKNTKSIHQEYNETKIEILKNEIFRLDKHLSLVYDHIKKHFSSENTLVALFSDHGYSYLSNANGKLRNDITKVPFLIKGRDLNPAITNELTSNVDIFKSIIKCAGYEYKNTNLDSNLPIVLGGNIENKYIVSESIHPNSLYESVLRDNNNKFYFKTNNVIKNGKINKNDYSFSLVDINYNQIKNIDLETKYLKIVLNQIDHFNNQ